jgi:hypothetical protein
VKFHSADAMALLYFLRNARMKIKRRNSLKSRVERAREREREKESCSSERLHIRGKQNFPALI